MAPLYTRMVLDVLPSPKMGLLTRKSAQQGLARLAKRFAACCFLRTAHRSYWVAPATRGLYIDLLSGERRRWPTHEQEI